MTQRQRFRLGVAADLAPDLLAAADRFDDGRGPEPERRGDPGEDLRPRMVVAGAAGVGGSLFPGLRSRCGGGLVPVQESLEPAGTTESEVVVVALEDREHAFN